MFPFIVAPITGDCVQGSFLVVTIREHYSGYRVSCLFISSHLYVLHPKSGLKYFYIRQTILTLRLEIGKVSVRVYDVSDFCLCMEECRIRHLSGWHWTWESLTIRDAWQAWHVSWAPSLCHIPPILIFRIITREILPRLIVTVATSPGVNVSLAWAPRGVSWHRLLLRGEELAAFLTRSQR